MTWTDSADLWSQVQKLWEKGELLTTLIDKADYVPYRLKLRKPGSWIYPVLIQSLSKPIAAYLF